MAAEKKERVVKLVDASARDEIGAAGTAASEDASHEREKRQVPDRVQLYVAEFRRRSAGLSGDELESEIARLLDRLVERQLAAVPESARPEVRDAMKRVLANDPAFGPMLAELRRSAASAKK